MAILGLFVALAVVFGQSLQQIFENIVFLFLRHPFDVGDLLLIDDDFYSVRRLELLSTLLFRWNGQYLLVENAEIAKKKVFNLSRSGLYWHAVEAMVDVQTW